MQKTSAQETDFFQQDPLKAVEQEVERKLIIVQDILQEEITKQEEIMQCADDAERHGDYRHSEGVIDGLDYAIAIIGDRLRDLWGM